METKLLKWRGGLLHLWSSVTGAIRIEAIIGLLAGILVVLGLNFFILRAVHPATTSPHNKPVEASIILGEDREENGLQLLDMGDGQVTVVDKDGVSCVQLRNRNENYLYFALEPAFKTSAHINALIQVEFLATMRGMFDVQYDGYKFGERPASVYSDTPIGIHFDPWPDWHRVTFEMSNARLKNRQNNSADFRLRVRCPMFYVRSVKLMDIRNADETPPETPTRTPPYGSDRVEER